MPNPLALLSIFIILTIALQIFQSLALNRIEKLLHSIKQTEREIFTQMDLDFTALESDVTDLTTVESGVETVLTALVTEVEALAATQSNPADQQKLTDFAAAIRSKITALSTAIANVPAKDLPPSAAPTV